MNTILGGTIYEYCEVNEVSENRKALPPTRYCPSLSPTAGISGLPSPETEPPAAHPQSSVVHLADVLTV